MITNPRRMAATGAATALGLATLLAPVTAASAASDKGLFGSQDPTYDGVYRQGLAITGLVAADQRVPKAAVTWLLGQQCGNGSFTAYRADLTQKCIKPDPANFSGPDTNSTALAAMSLVAVDRPAEAKAAFRYLRKQQNPDGGFPWFRGDTSDTNSTGLVLATMNGFSLNKAERKQAKLARGYLKKAQLRCAAPAKERGLLQFQIGLGTADALGSAQGAVGQLTTLPAARSATTGKKLTCSNGSPETGTDGAAGLIHALAQGLKRNNGLLPSSFGSGPDISSSATAAIALAAAEYKPGIVRTTVKALKKSAGEYSVTDGQTNAGATATLLLAAATTRTDPTRFGGIDLISALKDSRR